MERSDVVVLKWCDTCKRETAQDAMRLAVPGAVPAVLTVHYCTSHRGAHVEAAKQLLKLVEELWL